jgi:squalene-hopene/tetraprenyl-beta-curcumene cyclase
MSKALRAQGVKTLKGPDAESIDWKNELAAKLISLQDKDGSWRNSNKRWMEGDPNLTTSYVLVALSLLAN